MKNGRLVVLVALAGSWLFAVAVRLYDLQVRDHERYRQQAEEQQQQVVKLHPPRGTIFDARGRELAVSVEVSSAAAHPFQVEDPAATAAAVARAIDVDEDRLAAALASDKKFVWVKRKLDQPRADALRRLDAEGVFFLTESKRYYPLRRLASQVLGYVGTDNAGLAGLEFLYDSVVTSAPGQRTVVRDGHSATVLYPNLEQADATPGEDLHLTLDATIQSLVERELEKAIESSGARRGMAVVMDPESGAILAMASFPDFDPNDFAASPRAHWRNQVVEDAFEPGSTFKMVTLAAALEAGVVDPLETFDCERGGITLSGVRINDHHPFGELTTREIIAKSSNVGAIKLGLAAGRERLAETIRRFGFGRPTRIDLPSENAGLLRPLDRWSKLSPAYISFGQSISVTALQLTTAFAAIANGGKLLQPYVVESVGRDDDRRTVGKPTVAGLPVSPSSVIQARSMLESVVLDGTARAAALPGYRAAGKTGTAQKAIPGRGYAVGRYIASFVGFAPIRDPALVCFVALDEPWPRYHGGEVAAPLWRAIAHRTLLYLGVPPDRRDGEPWPPLPENREMVAAAAAPKPAGERIAAVPEGTVPDFAGLSARQAVSLSVGAGLRLALNGHGAVERQLPAPGTPLEVAGDTVEIWLATAGGT